MTSAGNYDMFATKLSPAGVHLWSKHFGDDNDQPHSQLAIDNDKNVLFTGFFFGTVDFGGGTLASAGDRDLFVAKFTP